MGRGQLDSCYVGHLHPFVTETDLFLLFSQVSPVHSVHVVEDAVTKESRGYGYVNFCQDHCRFPVDEAVRKLNEREIYGQRITVMAMDRDFERRRPEANVFVKGLDPEIDTQTLHDTFDVFGAVSSAKVVRSADGRSLGYGYIQFLHPASAAEAVTKANKMMLKQRTITVESFRPRRERRLPSFTNVFVKHLPTTIQNEEDLKNLFKPYGHTTSVFLPMVDNKPKGFGFVNFEKPGSAREAIKQLHEKKFNGTKLYVQKAQTLSERHKMLEERYRENKRVRDRETKGRNLYVKNFPIETTDDDLLQLFQRFGYITSAKVMFSNERPRGFGFVCFSTVKEAMTALQRMHGYWMGHKPLYVNVAQSFEERRRYLRRLKSMEFSMRAVYPPNGYYFPQTLPSFPTSASDMRYMGMSVPVPAMVPPSTIPFDRHYEMVAGSGKENKKAGSARKGKIDDFENDHELVKMGCHLYERVFHDQRNPQLAQKITGMLLDLGKTEVENVLNDSITLHIKIEEALNVLHKAGYFISFMKKTKAKSIIV